MKNVCLCLILVLLLNTDSNFVYSTKSLKLVQVLFRHGDRTPTETYKNDPYQNWPGGWGILTNVGKQQMYTLGQLLKDFYKDFLPKQYSSDFLYVRSSAADRCITSAQTLLAGLYPPTGSQIWNSNLLWQPITVRYVPRDQDNVIAMKKKCPVYEAALKAAYQSPRITKVNKENADLYEYLSAATGGKMYDINAVEFLYNTLEIEMLNNLTLPEWTKNVSFVKMLEIAKMNYAIFSDTTLMKRLTGGVFLNQVLSYVNQKINSTTQLDLVLYSGHDITIVTILRTLGFEEIPKLDYGAYIVFELYENINGDHEIKFLYGNNFESSPKNFELKSCPMPCTLNNFIDGYNDVLPTDWETECFKT